MKLEGSLETFPLRELVEMVVYSSVTGALNLFVHGEQGWLYFCDGSLYHVQRGPTQGVEALAELLEYRDGTFAFVSDMRVEAESLWGSFSHHMQTAERIATRWRQVRPYVPTLDLIPTLQLGREAVQRRIGPAHQPVLACIDGQRSLRQLAAALSWAEIDVAEAIVQMSVDGLVDLRNNGPQAQPAPMVDAPSSGGIFDRLRSRGQPNVRSAEAETPRPVENRNEDLILRLLRS